MDNIADMVANRLAQSEQKRDRDAMAETTLQRISREAAEEILYWLPTTNFKQRPNELAAIIYKHFRNGKEL